MIDPMLTVLIRYLHFFAIFGLAGALIIQNMAIKEAISKEDVRNLAKVNVVYGLCVILTFLCGLVLWLWLDKPRAFYSGNPLFLIKLGLFAFIVLLSICPTIFFVKNQNSIAESIIVPKTVRLAMKTELILLPIIAVLAYLMARGIGLDV